MIFNDEIDPALTPEEWRQWHEGQRYIMNDAKSTMMNRRAFDAPDARLPEMIALANAQLPADSPYKFTREDANLLSTLAGTVRAEPNTAGVSDDELDAAESRVAWHLRSLAERIAALLPPDTR